MAVRKSIYRTMRWLGIKLERYRDPFTDLAMLAGDDVRRIVDGGAYRGTASEAFLRLFPQAEVHAFEPQPDLYAQLVTEERRHSRWHVHNQALADVEGEARFHIPSAAFTASLLTPNESFGASRELVVQTTTLDAWARGAGSADVLKLDLQGAELLALRGAAEMLNNVRAVMCEVNFVRRYENCASFHEIAAMLDAYGFSLHRLYDIHSGRLGGWEFADAIFLRGAASRNS